MGCKLDQLMTFLLSPISYLSWLFIIIDIVLHSVGFCCTYFLEQSILTPTFTMGKNVDISLCANKKLNSNSKSDCADINILEGHYQFRNAGIDPPSLKHMGRISEVSVFHCIPNGHHPTEINNIPWSQMVQEWCRLSTFKNYDGQCSPILLAQQGFLYIGNSDDSSNSDDTVMCVFCSATSKVNKSYTVAEIKKFHQLLDSKCPFVLNLDNSNVPIANNNPSGNPESSSTGQNFYKLKSGK